MGINDILKTDYFIKRKIKNAVKEYKREHTFKSFDEIDDIVVLFDIQDWFDVEQVIIDLKKNNKSVTAWTVRPKEKDPHPIIYPEYVKIIDVSADVNWQQIPSQSILDRFEKQPYDTLLDLSDPNNNILTYLLLINTSNFCIGINETETKLYDFVMIRDNDEQDLFEIYKQIKFYLNNIFKRSNNS